MPRTNAATRPAGYGITFGGGSTTDNINCLRTSTLADLPSKSFACWFNAVSAGGSSGGRIVRRANFYLQYLSATAFSMTQIGTGNGGWSWNFDSRCAFGKWFHLAFTYDRSGGTPLAAVPILYINGQPITWTAATQPTGTITADGANNFVIGNTASSAGNRAYEGVMTQLYLYQRILTPAEILALYQGTDPVSTSLILKYGMRENAGLRTEDQSGNGYQGVILQASSWVTTPIPIQRTVGVARTNATTRAAVA